VKKSKNVYHKKMFGRFGPTERVPAIIAYFLIKNKVFTFNIIAHKDPMFNLQFDTLTCGL